MKMNKDTFPHIADIAKLSFDKMEEEQLLKDLKREVDFIDTMKKADTGNLEPLNYVHPVKNVFRDDTVTNTGIKGNYDKFMQDDFYVVPKTVE